VAAGGGGGAGPRFIRHQDGAAAIEFSLVALPFLALTFAILETALVFFAGQALETAVADAARLVMTGQAQTNAWTLSDFQKQVCGTTQNPTAINALFTCNNIAISVQTYSSFSSASTTAPVSNGQLDTSNLPFNTGSPCTIEVVQFYYEWPIYVSLLGNNLSNLSGNKRLLTATAVFRNEPYSSTGSTC
jgi:Flp pilus assembly protein TadG